MSYPRRLQLRRLARAASRDAEAVVALGAAALVAAAGESGLGLVLGLLSGVLVLASRRALRLAGRSRVGAESEARVRRALERLADDGWRVRHAIDWPGRGDLDHLVLAPSGIGFVIETKTLRWTPDHGARTSEGARWLACRRCRYPCGVIRHPSDGGSLISLYHAQRDLQTALACWHNRCPACQRRLPP